jgi:hypothetical protein
MKSNPKAVEPSLKQPKMSVVAKDLPPRIDPKGGIGGARKTTGNSDGGFKLGGGL